MANSRPPGAANRSRSSPAPPSRTAGPLGRFDAAQPGFFALQGDTQGPLGTNGDSASRAGVCRAPEYSSVLSFRAAVAPPEEGSEKAAEDPELWVFTKETFLQALSTAAAYTSTAKDALTWKKLWADFGLKGRYVLKTVDGTEYIIFKGYAGLRQTMTGTRYLAQNTKVLSMAIGRSGVIKSGVGGGVLSLFLVGAADIAEFLLRDDETLGELGVKLFSDLTKTMIATAIATAAAALVATASVPIIVPLAASIAVGVIASKGLDYLDQRLGLTKKLQVWVDQKTSEIDRILDAARRQLNDAGRRAAEAVEFLIRLKQGYDQLERELERLRRLLDHSIPSLL